MILSTLFLTISFDTVLNVISAIVTLATLVFAIVVAYNISFKKELRHKQLEIVFDLTQQLQNIKLYFNYLIINPDDSKVSSGDIWYHFFELTRAKLKEEELINFGKPKVYISEKFLYECRIFEFIHNPFLPKDIALKLINLYPRGGEQIKFDVKENEVYISDDRDYNSHIYRSEISQYYSTIPSFFNASEELQKSIRKWLKRYGVTDLNLIEKPINISRVCC